MEAILHAAAGATIPDVAVAFLRHLLIISLRSTQSFYFRAGMASYLAFNSYLLRSDSCRLKVDPLPADYSP